MPRPERHIGVCIQSRPEGHPRGSCGAQAAGNLLQSFSDELMAKKLPRKIALTQTTCLGLYHIGADVLVYPGDVMHASVNADDVQTLVDQHLLQVVEKIAPAEV